MLVAPVPQLEAAKFDKTRRIDLSGGTIIRWMSPGAQVLLPDRGSSLAAAAGSLQGRVGPGAVAGVRVIVSRFVVGQSWPLRVSGSGIMMVGHATECQWPFPVAIMITRASLSVHHDVRVAWPEAAASVQCTPGGGPGRPAPARRGSGLGVGPAFSRRPGSRSAWRAAAAAPSRQGQRAGRWGRLPVLRTCSAVSTASEVASASLAGGGGGGGGGCRFGAV